ncbi:MAG: hypothetical protein N2167_09525 [Flavobacteriales bacterium]|nr:hypothetical protein [Flavobacteriales bacterium]
MNHSFFNIAVFFSAMVGLFYQVVCGIAVILQFHDLYRWLRFYPFPVSRVWYALYCLGCIVALTGVWTFLLNNKRGLAYYFIGKMIILIFLIHAFMEKFSISYNEPYIETYLAGFGSWLIYPILFLIILKTHNT